MARTLMTSTLMGSLVCVCAIIAWSNAKDIHSEPNYLHFQEFIRVFNKTYSSANEHLVRYKVFVQSLERHKSLNAARTHPQEALYGVTEFSDMTPQQFASIVLSSKSLGYRKPSSKVTLMQKSRLRLKDVAPKFDWRNHKPSVITSVRNQGSCGGCWAFSITECLETQTAINTDKLYELSPQQIIDCADAPGDHGCGGGNICETLMWLNTTAHSVVMDKLYPYKAKTEDCKNVSSSTVAQVVDYTCQGYLGKEDLMVSLLNEHGPLAVAVDATSWQDYLGGIIQHHCYDREDNHAVQVVGYDKSGDVPYYIVRNSWGSSWGLSGYLYIKIGNNLCGIANTVGSLDAK